MLEFSIIGPMAIIGHILSLLALIFILPSRIWITRHKSKPRLRILLVYGCALFLSLIASLMIRNPAVGNAVFLLLASLHLSLIVMQGLDFHSSDPNDHSILRLKMKALWKIPLLAILCSGIFQWEYARLIVFGQFIVSLASLWLRKEDSLVQIFNSLFFYFLAVVASFLLDFENIWIAIVLLSFGNLQHLKMGFVACIFDWEKIS